MREDRRHSIAQIRRRTQRRDIIIAAGLNAAPGPESTYDTLFKFKSRARSLSVESKVQTFLSGTRMVKDALEQTGKSGGEFSRENAAFLDSTVNAAILNITPPTRITSTRRSRSAVPPVWIPSRCSSRLRTAATGR